MRDCSAAFPLTYRIALVWGLCLLAALFAVEAKMAWYGPVVGIGSAVRAAKAMPADSSKVVEHGVPTPDPVHPHIAFAVLTALFVRVPANLPAFYNRLQDGSPQFATIFLSPSLFFRPPPALS
ncbi:MAG TPA: hypothetical protein VFB43_14210 [Terracidiphilus sp.]|nr:hypothetical protein [Terracidiphilus sp.]